MHKTTVVTRNEDVIGLGLGNTAGNDTDVDFGNELGGDSRRRVRVLQIVGELLEILDRVDAVVRGREKSNRHRW